MPKLPQLFRWPSEKPGFAVQTGGSWHVVSDPEEVYKQYGKVDINTLPTAETGGVSASDMSFQDIQKMAEARAGEEDIGAKYEALQAKFGKQIPTSEYEKVFPPGSVGGAPSSPISPGGQFGTTKTGQRVDENDPRVQQYVSQGLNPDVAIVKVMEDLNRTTIPPSETPGIISSIDNNIKRQLDDALAGNKASIDAFNALPTTLPPTTTPTNTSSETPQIPQTHTTTTGEIFTPEAREQQASIEKRRLQLQEQELSDEESIRAEFDTQRLETERTLKANLEFGKALMAGRGILPATNSQYLQWYTETSAKNQQALNSILVSERKVLLEAQKAYQSADFTLLDKQLSLAGQMRERADKLQQYQVENEFKKADLQLKIAEFESEMGFKADEMNLKELQYGLDRAKELREAGRDQAEISLMVQKELREQKTANLEYTQSLADSLALSLVGSDINEIKTTAEDYGLDVNTLLSSVKKQEQAIQKIEFEQGLELEKAKLEQKKFEEDKRQFGLNYALKQREVAISEAKAKETPEQDIQKQQTATQAIGNINNLLSGDRYKNISGIAQSAYIPFYGDVAAGNEYNQLQGLLKLGIRSLIKGQGTVSDYEGKILGEAASDLSRWTNEEQMKQGLIKARGVLKTNSGQNTFVDVTSHKGEKIKNVSLSGEEIYKLVSEGNTVEYK